MTTALDLINAIESGKTLECEQVFADLVQSKVEAAIALRADEVRASMFESAELDEAVRVMSTNPAGGGMVRFPKNHPSGATAQSHRDATAKLVKQARSTGITLRKNSTERVDGANVMKYSSKEVKRESEELDELSKDTLGSYAKKASASAAGLATTAMHHKATEKQWRDRGEDERADEFSKQSFGATEKQIKRQQGVGKAVTRLTKESEGLDEGAKHVTFSGKDANKNPVNVHVGTDAQGNKYHVISGNPGVNHHPSKIFSGSHSEAEKKMSDVAGMVHSGKHDEALAHLNKTSQIKFSKAG